MPEIDHTERFTITIPAALHHAVKTLAARPGETKNSVVLAALQAYLAPPAAPQVPLTGLESRLDAILDRLRALETRMEAREAPRSTAFLEPDGVPVLDPLGALQELYMAVKALPPPAPTFWGWLTARTSRRTTPPALHHPVHQARAW